jgi:hypothetical protein
METDPNLNQAISQYIELNLGTIVLYYCINNYKPDFLLRINS